MPPDVSTRPKLRVSLLPHAEKGARAAPLMGWRATSSEAWAMQGGRAGRLDFAGEEPGERAGPIACERAAGHEALARIEAKGGCEQLARAGLQAEARKPLGAGLLDDVGKHCATHAEAQRCRRGAHRLDLAVALVEPPERAAAEQHSGLVAKGEEADPGSSEPLGGKHVAGGRRRSALHLGEMQGEQRANVVAVELAFAEGPVLSAVCGKHGPAYPASGRDGQGEKFNMAYRIEGLDPGPYAPLFALTDDELERRGAVRMTVTEHPGFPCRISLDDVPVGGKVILLNHVSHDVANPYRASHAIFVGSTSSRARFEDAVPPALERRLLSLRAFDGEGMMVDATLARPGEADGAIRRLFERADVAYIHAHNAVRGCFAARVDRR